MSDRSVVWKARLFDKRVDRTLVMMSPGARVLQVGTQQPLGGKDPYPVLWFQTDPDPATHTLREFVLVGTGFDVPPGVEYVGTFQIPDGLGDGQEFVGHVFEVPR